MSNERKVGSVVFPGDTFTAKQATGRNGKTRIGLGLTPSIYTRVCSHFPTSRKLFINQTQKQDDETTEEKILVTRAGVLKSRYANPPKLWVNSRQRRVKMSYKRMHSLTIHIC